MAFIVPAEIGHAPYAAPLLEFLASHFDVVQIIAIRDKLFPKLSEDCWLLYADGFGGATSEVQLTSADQFTPSPRPPGNGTRIALNEWRNGWNCRLRPFLLSSDVRLLYQYMSGRAPHLVRNASAASCTNTVHAVHVHEKELLRRLTPIWEASFVRLSCEIEGHPLGGGMLKLEPREAARVLLPDASLLPALSGQEVEDSLATLRTWKHYATGK